MSDNVSSLSVDGLADKAMSILGDDDTADATVTPIENLSDEGQAERIANESEPEAQPEQAGEVEASESEAEAETPIEPPVSWDADAKEEFKTFPRAAQLKIAEREKQRESHFGKSAQEIAADRKAIEADRTAIQTERQTYTQRLTQLIDMAQTMDPVIAEGRKMDWAKAHTEDPLGAPAKYFAWQQAEQRLNMMTQERERITQQSKAEQIRTAETKLAEALKDEWTNPDKRKAFQSDVRSILESHGYTPEEYADTTDARAILIARKAALYDKLMAQQSTIAQAKKAPQPANKVLKSQASNDGSDKSSRVEAALKRASKLTRTDDIAALVASVLE